VIWAQRAIDELLALKDAATRLPSLDQAPLRSFDLFVFLTLYFLAGIACGAGSLGGQDSLSGRRLARGRFTLVVV
jgi:hypothetical protein